MLKHVLGKVWNRGVNVYGGDKFRPSLYILMSGVHNRQVHCAPRSFFGVEDFLDDDNSRPYTYQKEKNSKNPTKHVSFKQCTVAYMELFTLDVFISKRFASASLTHRVTSKQVAVAESVTENDLASPLEAFKMTSNSSEQTKFEIEDIGTEASQTRQPEGLQVEEMQTQAISTLKPLRRGLVSSTCSIPFSDWLASKDFLNDCQCFMRLSPKVGELKKLEVFDLEGSEIMNLPQEIEKLTNLSCLEVSFYGYTSDGSQRAMQSNVVVPCGVISALSQLEELNIDVDPDDERWDACVEAIVYEVFTLKRHATAKKLSNFGARNMEKLKCLVMGECNEVQVIIDEEDDCNEIVSESSGTEKIVLESLEYLYVYYMKSLRSIWEGSVQKNSLFLLKSLTLRTCPQLTTIFTQGLLANLCNLEELKVEDCPSIYSIVSCEISAELKTSDFLPNLKKISLHYMPGLVSISSGLHIAPKLEWLSFYDCPNLKNPLIDEVSTQDLKKIKGERSWWEALEWSIGCPGFLDEIFVPINI
uniref:Disease resistance protein At4g27190-like leucine-rich repeats domain-containing protein n=1 Tax=Fagus sylvatica TaxID=28930 RepID=A0A2N9GGB3_FAGSY